MHNHGHCCEHEHLAYCKCCRVVYCKDCGKEWREYPIYWSGTTYGQQPAVTWTCSSGNTVDQTPVITCKHGG